MAPDDLSDETQHLNISDEMRDIALEVLSRMREDDYPHSQRVNQVHYSLQEMGTNGPEDDVFRFEGYEYGDPCPNCGETNRFGETCEAHGTTYFDEDGNVQEFNQQLVDNTLVVECLECETKLLDKR